MNTVNFKFDLYFFQDKKKCFKNSKNGQIYQNKDIPTLVNCLVYPEKNFDRKFVYLLINNIKLNYLCLVQIMVHYQIIL